MLPHSSREFDLGERRYQALVQASASVVWRADPTGSILDAVGWDQLTGQPLDFYRGEGWLASVHPEDRATVLAVWEQILKSSAPGQNEFRVRRADGEYRWVSSRAVPLRDESGVVHEWVGTLSDIHDRKSAELQLEKQKELLAAALRAARMVAWDWDLPTGEVARSETSMQVLGISSGPVSEFLARVHQEDRAGYERTVAEAARTSAAYQVEFRYWGPDGQLVWLRETGQVELTPEGKPARAHGLLVDRTKRRAQGESLRRTEARYRLVTENTSDMIVLTDPNRVRQYVSGACRELLGWSPDELVGTQSRGNVHPEDRDRVWADLEGVFQGRQEQATTAYRLRHKDGHWVHVEARRRLLIDDAGQAQGVVSVVRDISDRVELERRARESEARYKLLADHATDMIVQADLDTTSRYVSPASRELLGWEPEELVGTRPLDGVHPDDAQQYKSVLDELTSGRTNLATHSQRYRRKDGSWVWTEANFRLVRDENGTPKGYVASVRDVSKRHEQAEEIARARAAAEQALAVAEQASKAKTDFLAGMSHEIRTPLNSVLGFTNLLLDDGRHPPEVRRKLELIQGSGAALLTVVNDILDFSKIEAGQVELDPVHFALPSLVDNAVSIVQGVVGPKPVEIRAEIEPRVPTFLFGDNARLQQVLLNLMNNAVKFTSAGHVTLSVREVGAIGGRVDLLFRVSDTGIGIPTDKLTRLFERFMQADSSVTRQYGGTGLGLAISKRLIELMDGEIGVESVEGQGSTFWFRVPLPLGTAPAERAHQPGAKQSAESGGARILLVEDLDINQELARLVLEAAGHSVEVASNGAEAVEAVQHETYDVVLMDIQMPVMDGITAAKTIRGLPGDVGKVPIIAMTANVLPQQVSEFRRAGMDGHVGKPFKKEELLQAIAEHVSGIGQERAPPTEEAGSGSVLASAEFASVAALVGADRARAMLGRLADQLRERFPDDVFEKSDTDELARNAHAIVSTAGMLGFESLSVLCREVETRAREGGDLSGLLARLRARRDNVLAEIRGLTPETDGSTQDRQSRGAPTA